MFKHLNKIKGQSTLEYAVLIIIIIGALLSIQVYIKRGVQGRMKSAADDIGDQYSPGNTNILTETTVSSRTAERFSNGSSRSELLGNEVTSVNKSENIINVQSEYWGN